MCYDIKFIWKLIIAFLIMIGGSLFLLSRDIPTRKYDNKGNTPTSLQEEINKFLFNQQKSDTSFQTQYGAYIKI